MLVSWLGEESHMSDRPTAGLDLDGPSLVAEKSTLIFRDR